MIGHFAVGANVSRLVAGKRGALAVVLPTIKAMRCFTANTNHGLIGN